MMNTFNRSPQLKSPWQVLSAESAGVILPFCALATVNFFALVLNWRIPAIAEYNTIHQIIVIAFCGVFLGSYDIRHKRQEFLTTQPFKRSQIILNRLLYGFYLVLICCVFNYLLFSGLMEETLYQEIWMDHQHDFSASVILLMATLLISLSLAQIAQTLSGVTLSLIATFLFYYAAFISDTNIESQLNCIILGAIAILLFCSAFWEYRKMSLLQVSIKPISKFSITTTLSLVALCLYSALLFYNQEGGL